MLAVRRSCAISDHSGVDSPFARAYLGSLIALRVSMTAPTAWAARSVQPWSLFSFGPFTAGQQEALREHRAVADSHRQDREHSAHVHRRSVQVAHPERCGKPLATTYRLLSFAVFRRRRRLRTCFCGTSPIFSTIRPS